MPGPTDSQQTGARARPRLRAMDAAETKDALQSAGHPAYRGRQVFQWVYEKGAESIDAMSNLPKDLRAWLTANAPLGGVDLVEVAGDPAATQKMVLRTDDGELIESVLMRNDDAVERDDEPAAGSTAAPRRVSLCVSSQVGCPLACTFCMTGVAGYRRDLRVDEIVDQVLHARRLLADDEHLSNMVFMGMGEPLLNLDAVIGALRLITSPHGIAFSTRRITVSTAGVTEGIDALGRADTGANLAVSLNATSQDVRDRIMPGCRRWPLDDVLAACRRFPLAKRRRITYEYVLLDGINDTEADARRLAKLVHGAACKINLIAYNADDEIDLRPSPDERAEAFRAELVRRHLTVSLRRSKGRHHHAACGQLAAHRRRG